LNSIPEKFDRALQHRAVEKPLFEGEIILFTFRNVKRAKKSSTTKKNTNQQQKRIEAL